MGHVLDHFPTYSGSLIGPLSHLQQPHPSIQVPYGSPCVLCQEEGWFTSPCTGLSEVERDHGQELLLPLVSDVLTHLHGAEFFTILNLHWGFNNVWIKEGNEWKAAFWTN